MLRAGLAALAWRGRAPAAAALQQQAARCLAAAAGGETAAGGAQPPREQLRYDLCIVGAGPAGLTAAIRFKQLCAEGEKDLSVCVLEKGSEVGAHILSGNVFEPTALEELYPGWRAKQEAGEAPFSELPLRTGVSADRFYMLTRRGAWRLPVPSPMKGRGKNYVASLSELTRWLAARAEEAGVDVFPGTAGREVLHDWHNAVVGVATGDKGRARDGTPKPGFAPGVDVLAKLTLFAEGARGSLTQGLLSHYGLVEAVGACPQTYALGIKEVWEVPEAAARPGLVVHTVGWPLDAGTYGGGWLYHMDERRVSLGLVVGLDYSDPGLNPYEEFQQFKRHPLIAATLEGGRCLQYGARTLNEGGVQSIPKLVFPGGALIGCAAGFLNVPKIRGTHTAMKSGALAGEEAFRAIVLAAEQGKKGPLVLDNYAARLEASWVHAELERGRNVRPGFRRPDHDALRLARDCPARAYAKPDGVTTFDLPTSLYRSGTNHEHDQPCHLVLRNPGLPAVVNLPHYGGPETRYCPAGVYEYAPDALSGRPALRINAQNCLHCKACSIKDPRQNIVWNVPEGGGGPNYTIIAQATASRSLVPARPAGASFARRAGARAQARRQPVGAVAPLARSQQVARTSHVVCVAAQEAPAQQETATTWYALVANAEFFCNDVQNEPLAEQLRERVRYFQEQGRPTDFYLVPNPAWLDARFPAEAKQVRRPCMALVSTDKQWVTFMKLRLDRVMKLELPADMAPADITAPGEALPEFKKPEKWTAPYAMYAPKWWEKFYAGA
ncbi:hypothetical protein HT031_000013 [Scenedesmus sp. PABB004]|nr:hypothetical protein HT031_000013 [Scenedesmus sp. PABB004]